MQHRQPDPAKPAKPSARAASLRGPPRPPDFARHPSFEGPIQRALAKGRQCDDAGCFKLSEDFGHLCMDHRNAERRHGHPTAGSLPRKYTGAWIVQARRYIAQLDQLDENHPARRQLALARHWVSMQFYRAAGYDNVSWKAGQSNETKWRRHAATLERHGVVVDEVLAW
jgi:hypothetical protein